MMKVIRSMKSLFVVILSLVALGCSSAYQPKEVSVMNLHLGDSTYAELADFLYDFAGRHRLTVLWFGWYKVDNAQAWYERSEEDSTFKVKLELLTEENGSLVFTSYFDKPIASVSIDYADKKPEWMKVISGFEQAIEAKGWYMEHVKTNVLD